MIAKVYSAIPEGYEGRLIEVEADASRSLPSFNIVGMANKTISEARERVRSAISNSDFRFPDRRVTINLAPAEALKDGSHLDLPIALAILILSQQLLPGDVHERLFVGELSLNGQTKPIRGIINIVETALTNGFKEIYVPAGNAKQASLVPNAKIIAIDDLKSLFLHLKGINFLPEYKNHSSNTNFSDQSLSTPVTLHVVKNTYSGVRASSSLRPQRRRIQNHNVVKTTQTDGSSNPSDTPVVKITQTEKNSNIQHVVKNNQTDTDIINYTLDAVQGQTFIKRALIVAIAGNHNILLSGPPGSGKTMLAKVARNLLPPPSAQEQIEIAKIHNLIQPTSLSQVRPFRCPHHTASSSAIIGGGTKALPGEISLAHRGILFLDELPEFDRSIIESLRQPLEDGTITVSRINQRTTYPAQFMLIATMNPCPCGYLGDPNNACTCRPIQILNYQKRLSGPILDRIDIIIPVQRVPTQVLLKNVVKNTDTDINIDPGTSSRVGAGANAQADTTPNPEHQKALHQILTARQRQKLRYQDPNKYNNTLSSSEIKHYLKLNTAAKSLLETATDRLQLSARSYLKIIKVAQTIADIESSSIITPEYIAEALSFRERPT